MKFTEEQKAQALENVKASIAARHTATERASFRRNSFSGWGWEKCINRAADTRDAMIGGYASDRQYLYWLGYNPDKIVFTYEPCSYCDPSSRYCQGSARHKNFLGEGVDKGWVIYECECGHRGVRGHAHDWETFKNRWAQGKGAYEK
jgi:hypothetical protein